MIVLYYKLIPEAECIFIVSLTSVCAVCWHLSKISANFYVFYILFEQD